MSLTPIRPGQHDEEDFESIKTWVVPQVYERPPVDWWADITVEAGWNPGNGETIRIGRREFTKTEAELLARHLTEAVRFLDGYFVWQGEIAE